MKRLPILLFLGICCLMLATDARSGARDHLDGFFLRLAAGGSPGGTEISDPSGDAELSGVGVDLEIAIGGVVAPNLAVHGTLFGWSIADPDAKVGGVSGNINGDLSLGAVGAGVTYFIMPANFYLTGTVGFGSLTLDVGGVSGDSDTGVVLEFAVGKEWFVSDRWGLGAAVGLMYHSIPDGVLDENWSGLNVPIRFSATFN